LWNKTYDSPHHSIDEAKSVTTDSSNNIYLVGSMKVDALNYNWWIKKFDSTGVEDTSNWNITVDTSGNSIDWATSGDVDTDNNVYVVGMKQGNWWIKKFDSSGNEDTTNWNKTYSSAAATYTLSVMTDTVNNVYVAGYGTKLNSSEPTSTDWWIKKFDSNGNEDTNNWNLTYNGGFGDGDFGDDEAKSVAVDTNGNIYVAGYGENLNNTNDND
jgi:hypothetical protein